jgi:hypothetical protein
MERVNMNPESRFPTPDEIRTAHEKDATLAAERFRSLISGILQNEWRPGKTISVSESPANIPNLKSETIDAIANELRAAGWIVTRRYKALEIQEDTIVTGKRSSNVSQV